MRRSVRCVRRRGVTAFALRDAGTALAAAVLLTLGSAVLDAPQGAASEMASLLWPSAALAQGAGSTDYLIRLLHDSDAFRVRVRAADALGSRSTEPGVIPALTQALTDENAAVRAAAAASLGRVGDASSLSALRALDRDSEAAVRTAARAAIAAIEGRSGGGAPATGGASGSSGGTPRFYVGIGLPGTTAGVSDATRAAAREAIRRAVGAMDGVVLAPDGEAAAATTRVLRSRSLSGFYLDSSISTVEDTSAGVRVAVQIIVQDYPGRNMRAMLSGRATVTGVHDTSSPAVAEAMAAAFASAVRGLPAAMGSSRGGGSR